MTQRGRIIKAIRTTGVLCLLARRMTRIPRFSLAVAVATLMAGSAWAQTWTGGADPDKSWGTGANWGGSTPANPATGLISFNADGSVGGGVTTITSILDQDRTLNAGMRFGQGDPDNGWQHNVDLGAHSLTLIGNTLTVGLGGWTAGDTLTFTNGTLIVGQATKANIGIGNAGCFGYLRINCSFTHNLGTVRLGSDSGDNPYGTLDLRKASPSQSSFACDELAVGRFQLSDWIYAGNGWLYLNDVGGVIKNLTVASSFTFGNREVWLNAGATIDIGSIGARATMAVGQVGNATLAPSGQVTAYLTSLILGDSGGTGTLNLTNAPNSLIDVDGTVSLGYNAGAVYDTAGGIGILRLGTGTANFKNLNIGGNTTVAGNLLTVRGATVTIGVGGSSVFNIASGRGTLELDFTDAATQLKVWGDYRSADASPAKDVDTYIADGRIRFFKNGSELPGGTISPVYRAPYTYLYRSVARTVLIIE